MNYTIGRVRHLCYHIYPARLEGGDCWRRNVAALRERISLFNGRRVIGVAIGPHTDRMDAVERAFAGTGAELLEVRNAPSMRECTTLVKMYEKVSGFVGPEHVTLHGHAKGITSESWATGVRSWVESLYELCLDYWPRVEMMLQTFPIVGPYFREWTDWTVPGFVSNSTWHYSGAWRWFRNADMFSREWRYVEPFWCGSESHPSMVFGEKEAGNLFHKVLPRDRALYLKPYWDQVVTPELQRFRAEHEGYKQKPVQLTCILTSHNKPEYVRQAIRSILDQTYSNWQLLVMDSGVLYPELKDYASDPRITVAKTGESEHTREQVGIQAWAINECFRRGLVHGDLVAYLCDDDIYHPKAFQGFVDASRSQPKANAWCGRASRVEISSEGRRRKIGTLLTYPVGTELDCKVDGIQTCHRASIKCPWPEDKEVSWHADGMFLRGLRNLTEIHPLNLCVGEHRHTPLSTFTRSTPAGLVSCR